MILHDAYMVLVSSLVFPSMGGSRGSSAPRESSQPQRRGRSGCGCCIGWNPNKTRMKCGLHSRKTVLEHPLCPSRKYSVLSWEISFARLDHQRVYIMFMHVYALFIHVLPILRSNNKFHGLLYSFRRSLETMHQWLSTADHFWCGLFDPSKEFKGCALQQGCLDLFKSTMDDFKGIKALRARKFDTKRLQPQGDLFELKISEANPPADEIWW